MNKRKLPNLHPLLLRALAVLGTLLVALALSVMSFFLVRSVVFARQSTPGLQEPVITDLQGTPILDEQGNPLPGNFSQNPNSPASQPTLTPWDGAGRVTILILGLDYRDWSSTENGPSRSDTMILLTLDPLTKTAGMLSVPRDMWVAIPGFKHGKINTAYYLGDAYKLPGGGPGLAVKTVEQFLGVPINYYAQIDFDAFIRFIDEIGGVKIDVPQKIQIDPLGDNNTKTLKPGVQTLPGDLALAYARQRHTDGGDFDRARRQQQVILGIRDRIVDFDMLPTLITKAPTLYRELASGINTNLTLDQAAKLALLAKDIPPENIKRGVLGEKYTIFGRSPDNLSIVIPIPDKIHLLRDEIFATSGSLGPLTPGNALQQMQAEGASLVVYNGSRDPGLGQRSADYLRAQGANVNYGGEADQRYAATTLIDHRGSPYMLKYLQETFQVNSNRIYSEYDPNAATQVEIYLGYDAEALTLP
jgi:LCP family protein required for cell wall assembly